MTWIDHVRDMDVPTIADGLGLTIHRGTMSPCPGCGEEKRGKGDPRGPVGVRPDRQGWRCHRCDVGGDGLDLAAQAIEGRRARDLDRDSMARLRAWYASRGWCSAESEGPEAPQPSLPPQPEPEPEKRIPAGELAPLWKACSPVADEGAVADWLRGRGYDPAAVRAARCVQVIPDRYRWPEWWPSGHQRWPLVALLRDGAGTPAGMHGRAIDPEAPRKTSSPLRTDAGYSFSGLWMANPAARSMMLGKASPGRCLIVEGVTDFLRACDVTGSGDPLPILAGISGSFGRIDEIAWPDGCQIIVATDADAAGDRYAEHARRRLPGRVHRAPLPAGQDIDDVVRTRADLEELIASAAAMPEPAEERPRRKSSEPTTAPEGDDPIERLAPRIDAVKAAADRPSRLAAFAEIFRHREDLAAAHDLAPVDLQRLAFELAAAGIAQKDADKIVTAGRDAAKAAKRAAKRWGSEPRVISGQGTPKPDDGALVVTGVRPLLKSPGSDLIPEGLLQAQGWQVNPNGVHEVRETPDGGSELQRRALAPVVVTGRYERIDSGEIDLDLVWYQRSTAGSGWRSAPVARDKVADRQKLVALARKGFPVHSGCAGDLVRYLAACEATNAEVLPLKPSAACAGWHEIGGRRLFLLGDQILGGDDDQRVELIADDGYRQVLAGLHRGGTFEGWRDAVQEVEDRPSMMIALYGSTVPSLMAPIISEIEPFAIDWSGGTSEGKTTALRLASSLWGCPDERAGETFLHTWEATRVWIERVAGLLPGLPLCLDDTKRARAPQDVQRVVYDVTSGRGRGRGTITGLQATVSWRTVLLSTGESKITSIGRAQQGGAAVRALELWGSPLGGPTPENADLARATTSRVLRHYGHAGPRIVQWLLDGGDDRRKYLRDYYLERAAKWSEGRAGAGDRAMGHVAALDVAALVCREALGIPWSQAALTLAAESADTAAIEANKPQQALESVIQWATSQANRFDGARRESGSPPAGYLGAWFSDSATYGHRLAVFPHLLRRFLDDEGYDASAVLASWADNSWLWSEPGRPPSRPYKRVQVGGKSSYCVVVRGNVVADCGGADSDDDDAGDWPGEGDEC